MKKNLFGLLLLVIASMAEAKITGCPVLKSKYDLAYLTDNYEVSLSFVDPKIVDGNTSKLKFEEGDSAWGTLYMKEFKESPRRIKTFAVDYFFSGYGHLEIEGKESSSVKSLHLAFNFNKADGAKNHIDKIDLDQNIVIKCTPKTILDD